MRKPAVLTLALLAFLGLVYIFATGDRPVELTKEDMEKLHVDQACTLYVEALPKCARRRLTADPPGAH
jgi:hypothetical protein